MSIIEITIMAGIVAGACYLVYRSLFAGKGPCSGCGRGGSCEKE